MLSHEICICTRGRSETLIDLLNSLSVASRISEKIIRVVFNGENPSNDLVEFLESLRVSKQLNILIDFSDAGLAKARNHALKRCDSDLITFIDDDIDVGLDFCESIESLFLSNTSLIGSAPLITGMYLDLKTTPRGRLHHKRILGGLEGKVTKSGMNFWFADDENLLRNCEAMWLPGCCMTYRTHSIQNLRFAEELQNGPTGGYSLGEDIIFSMKARTLGTLQLNESLRISHFKAPSVRDNNAVMAKGLGRFLAYQTKVLDGSVLKSLVFSRLIRELSFLMVGFLIKPSTKRNQIRYKSYEIWSFLQELVSPILNVNNEK